MRNWTFYILFIVQNNAQSDYTFHQQPDENSSFITFEAIRKLVMTSTLKERLVIFYSLPYF